MIPYAVSLRFDLSGRPDLQGSVMNIRKFPGALSCLCLVLAGWPAASAGDVPAKAPGVLVARPVVQEVTDYEDCTGRTEASARVDLRARVTGYLVKTLFPDGAEVKQGDLLFEIDPRPYRARLDAAEAALGVAAARAKLAQTNSQRLAALFAKKQASQEELDRAAGDRQVAEAEVQAAKAGLEIAKLNLAFTRIQAPISGQIGRRLIDPGNLVEADKTNLAVLVSRDPLYVYFDIDERTSLRLRLAARDGKLKGEKTPVQIGVASAEKGFPHQGLLDFADNRVNADTGTIRLRAVMANKNKVLLPGMFVRVRLRIGEPYKALLIPADAIMSEQGQKLVYIVNAKDMVESRRVAVGQGLDDRRVIKEGLNAEDRVVIGNLQRLRPGDSVQPREQEIPPRKPKPRPKDRSQGRAPPGGLNTGPGILVETVYPGASAEVVSDSVRAPIENQVSNMEKLRHMRSRCDDEGKYGLDLVFQRGINREQTQVLVQNRVNLALPVLPDPVQNAGISVLRGASGVLLIATLSAPGGRFDELYLSNYANLHIKDELSRLPGVGHVSQIGESDYRLRISLDPEKLAALNLAAADVLQVLKKNQEPGEGTPEKMADLIVKAGGAGRVVRLRDVGTVEPGADRPKSQAFQEDKPVVALVVYLTGDVAPRKVRAAIQEKLGELRSRLPEGLDLKLPFDFTANQETPGRPTTPEYLVLDLDFPNTASVERIVEIQKRCLAMVREVPGTQEFVALSENPFDVFGKHPCLLLRLASTEKGKSNRDEVIRAIRARLTETNEIKVRVRDLSWPGSFPQGSYPINMAMHGPELKQVQEWAAKIAEKLGQDKKLTDVWLNRASWPQPQIYLNIDRDAARTRGVSLRDIFSTLELALGSLSLNSFNRFGRTWRVQVRSKPEVGSSAKDIAKFKVRNSAGQMVPLSSIATVRETEVPAVLDFLDSRPMVEVTANPATEVSIEEARKLCEAVAEEVRKELRLPAEYRLTWL